MIKKMSRKRTPDEWKSQCRRLVRKITAFCATDAWMCDEFDDLMCEYEKAAKKLGLPTISDLK